MDSAAAYRRARIDGDARTDLYPNHGTVEDVAASVAYSHFYQVKDCELFGY